MAVKQKRGVHEQNGDQKSATGRDEEGYRIRRESVTGLAQDRVIWKTPLRLLVPLWQIPIE